MVTLENEALYAEINTKGAELCRLMLKGENIDFIWNGQPEFWAKNSPVLFPIVGTLVNNQYEFEGKTYSLPRHGFARDKTFTLEDRTNSSATFSLQWTDETFSYYPFHFRLEIRYQLTQHKLTVTYTVHNLDEAPMLFSIGAHPAFHMPLEKGLAYTDYNLSFHEGIDGHINPLDNGLLLHEKQPVSFDSNTLPLHQSLFSRDALVFTGKMPDTIRVSSSKSVHGFDFHMHGWPHLGLWAAPNAPFLCIEPWQGHADFVDHNGQLNAKPGIINLPGGGQWQKGWSVVCF